MPDNEIKILLRLDKSRSQNNVISVLSNDLDISEYDIEVAISSLLEKKYVSEESDVNQKALNLRAFKITREGERHLSRAKEDNPIYHPTPDDTLKVKKYIIKDLKKKHFKYHSYINLTDYIENSDIKDHNHNGVAHDICKLMHASGDFICTEKGTKPEYYLEKAVIKSWQTKFWWVLTIIAYVMGVASPIIVKSIEQKIWPEPSQAQLTTTIPSDSLKKHKTR